MQLVYLWGTHFVQVKKRRKRKINCPKTVQEEAEHDRAISVHFTLNKNNREGGWNSERRPPFLEALVAKV